MSKQTPVSAAFMCVFNGPLGFITAIPLILGEAAAITNIIARTFYLGPALEDLFDEVNQKGCRLLMTRF
jgi:hypothetical protein